MDDTPHKKKQVNVYLPEDIDAYIESIVGNKELIYSKSEVIHILLAYARQHFTPEIWEKLVVDMRVLGEFGLERIEYDVQ